MILDSVLIEFFTETNQSEPVTSQSPVKFDPTCGDFVCSSNDFVSSGCKRDLFLVGAGDDHDKPFLYGAPQEFKIWQYKNMDSIVHVIGSHEPCHSLENAQYPPTFQDFIIFDLGGAALISIEVCRICGRSRTAVDDCYDLFLCKARLPADKITLKNKVGFGITMALSRHFVHFLTRRQCMNDLYIRLKTILAGDTCLKRLLGESYQYCFSYKKLQKAIYGALASCNIMEVIQKGSCLHRHDNEVSSLIFDVVWIGQNAGYMPDR